MKRVQGEPYLLIYASGKIKWFIQIRNNRYDYLKYLAFEARINIKNKCCLLKPEYDFSEPPTLNDFEIITQKESIKRNLISGQPKEIQKLIRSLLPLTNR